MDDRMISAKQLAEYLGMTESGIRRWVHDGKGPPSYLLVGKRMFRQSEVDEWITDNAGKALAQ